MTSLAQDRVATSAVRASRYLVIRNPAAGIGSRLLTSAGRVDDLQALLERHGVDADVAEPEDEEAARALVRTGAAEGMDLVAAGGDGTVHMIAEELIGTDRALGILPMGRVMNIARSLGIERDLDTAADVLAGGHVRAIDVGEATTADGRTVEFLEAASVGLNAAIFREATRADEGHPTSIPRTIWVALRYRPARMHVELDEGAVETRALMVTVSNGPYVGLGMTVAPGARLDDGRFDVRIFRGFSRWELLRHLASIAFGRRSYEPQISTYRSAVVSIRSARPLPARADSDDLGTTPVTFRTLPGALRVVAPAPSASNPTAAPSAIEP